MGIRMVQYQGLNEWAQKFVEGEQVFAYEEHTTKVYPDGRRVAQQPRRIFQSSVKREEYDKYIEDFGGIEENYPLYMYTMPDGRVYYEYLQSTMWSSGPCLFIALKDEKGNVVQESLWTDEEQQAA